MGWKEIYNAVFSVKQSAFKNGFSLLNFALHSTCEYTHLVMKLLLPIPFCGF